MTSRVLTIRARFADESAEPVSEGALLVKCALVAQLYAQASYGRCQIEFVDVGSVVAMPEGAAYYKTSASAVVSDARTAAQARGFDYRDFRTVFVVTNNRPRFAWGGVSAAGGFHVRSDQLSVHAIAHELGHAGFRLQHANSLLASGADPLYGAIIPYGDPASFMNDRSGSLAAHPTPVEKAVLGWLVEGEDLVTVDPARGPAKMRLVPYESQQSGVKAIRVIARRLMNYVEWDFFLCWRVNCGPLMDAGAQLHLGRHEGYGAEGSVFLDLAPQSSGGNFDGVLTPGNSFFDGATGLRFVCEKIEAGELFLEIGQGAIGEDAEPPSEQAPSLVEALRFTITGLRGGAKGAMQLAELTLLRDGAVVPWPAGTRCAEIDYAVSSPRGEEASKLVDGLPGTKWLSQNFGGDGYCAVDIVLGTPVAFDAYSLTQANDARKYPARNPVSWRLEVRRKGVTTWAQIDVQTNLEYPPVNFGTVGPFPSPA